MVVKQMYKAEMLRFKKPMILIFMILSIFISGCINIQNDASVKPVATLITTPSATTQRTITEVIRGNLIGTNITYYDFAGRPVNYTIIEYDIKDIQETTFKGALVWKVKIGEGLSWNIYMDEKGEKIIEVEQLFRT